VSTNRRIKRVGELDILSDTLSRGKVRRYRGKEGWVLLQGWVCTCCGQQRRRQEARQRQQRMTSQVKECPLLSCSEFFIHFWISENYQRVLTFFISPNNSIKMDHRLVRYLGLRMIGFWPKIRSEFPPQVLSPTCLN
jgi:hypothetical protein